MSFLLCDFDDSYSDPMNTEIQRYDRNFNHGQKSLGGEQYNPNSINDVCIGHQTNYQSNKSNLKGDKVKSDPPFCWFDLGLAKIGGKDNHMTQYQKCKSQACHCQI